MSSVTITQTTVVTPVVVNVLLANRTGPLPVNGCHQCTATETTSAVAMAAISLQALMRHQYQRSR